jgi:ABC-2 type transport system permease protein
MIVPTGAIVASLFSLACGIVFVSQVLDSGAIATMRPVFDLASWLLLLLCPAITMRLIAEERRVGTWESLLAMPAGTMYIVKAKFYAAWLFLAMMLATTIPLVAVLEVYADVDYGAVASGYLGLMLLGAAVISSGLLVSALTTSQTVAYLVTTFFWITISLACKVLPAYLPTRFADIVFAIDPDLRVGEFSIGLIDTANIMYFVAFSWVMGWLTIVAIDRTRHRTASVGHILSCGVLLLISLFAVNDISMNERFRMRVDGTGSRSYTLSDQTKQLLNTLDQPWKIVVLLDESKADRAMLKQVDEVLRQYRDASSYITIHRINPSSPDAISSYDELLRDLISIYGEELRRAEFAIQDGIESFLTLMTFATSTSAWAETVSQIPSTDQEEETLQTLANSLALLGNDGGLILDEVKKAMLVNIGQPLPQLSVARDILVAASSRWSTELIEVAGWLREGRTGGIASLCATEAHRFNQIARTLAIAEDQLLELGTLELGKLAAQLAVGEGAVIMSPDRATMIPATLLFPKTVGGNRSIATDQRFRGEQIISSAIRSLHSEVQPTVVFMHSEENSLLVRRRNNIDLWAARGLLETSRFGVMEWIPFDDSQPNIPEGPVVWVVIPPSSRAGIEPTPNERALLDSTATLIANNEPVLLNLQPSMLPRYGQRDPWAELVRSIGLEADTGRVLFERVAVGPNQLEVQRGQLVHQLHSDHLISRAVNGRQVFLPLPIRVQGGETLINIAPSEDRWLEKNWATKISGVSVEDPLTVQTPIAAAVEQEDGARAVVVGSGGWMLTWAADRAMTLGGDQIAMVNPGNSELLLAAVTWLSGFDDWIAAGPIGQQSSRVGVLSRTTYLTWAAVLVLGIPLLLLGTTTVTTLRRHGR